MKFVDFLPQSEVLSPHIVKHRELSKCRKSFPRNELRPFREIGFDFGSLIASLL